MNRFNFTPPPIDSTPRNANIDCLKALCAFFVVAIHFPLLKEYGATVIYNMAVPTFFTISGYLLYNADPDRFQQRLLKNLKNIIKITFWASLLYFAFRTIPRLWNHNLGPIITTNSIIDWLIFHIYPFHGILWYLYAYIYTLIFLYFVSCCKSDKLLKYFLPIQRSLIFDTYKIIKVLSKILIVVAIIIGQYSFLFDMHHRWVVSLSFLFTGLPYFTIGMIIKENLDYIRQKITRPFIFLIIFLVLAYLEWIFLKNTDSTLSGASLFSVFCTISFFLTFVLSKSWNESWISKIGRDYSLYIYIFHGLVGELFIISLNKIPHTIFYNIFDYFKAIIVYFASILFSYLFIKAKDLIYSRLLKRA